VLDTHTQPLEVDDEAATRSTPAQRVVRADRYWLRLPASAVCFSVFGVVSFLLGVIVLPLVRIFSLDAQRGARRARQLVGGGLRWFVGFMRIAGVVRYTIEGLEKLDRPGQVIIANHPTLIDVVFLLGFVPKANCIVKTALFAHPVTRNAVVAANYIPNAPTDEMIHRAEAALFAGESLLIFPEGTRTVPGQPSRLQRGGANIALRAARVLTPVFISCNPPTLSKNEPWYRIPPQRAHIVIRVGEDIDLDRFRHSPLPSGSRQLNAYLTELFSDANKVRDSRP
jgi:1-acyl-sn-glycerol-3-phosphate acyltransferase